MILRHSADRRTLLWAFVLMPGAAIVHYTTPQLGLWLLPISMYLAYSAGVIAHNHNHSATFTGGRANTLFSAWISFFYGYPVFAWIPTHNRNHHKYVNSAADATRTLRDGQANTLWRALTFFFTSSAAQAPLIKAFLRDAKVNNRPAHRRHMAQYLVVFGGHALACGCAIALHGASRGLVVYGSALGVPALGALWGLMFTNYVQHVDCDPASRWNHSRNFVSSWMNFLVFDNGFHTVHHDRPGLHWSLLRAEHARIAHQIEPRLNEQSILGYVIKAYCTPPWRRLDVSRRSAAELS